LISQDRWYIGRFQKTPASRKRSAGGLQNLRNFSHLRFHAWCGNRRRDRKTFAYSTLEAALLDAWGSEALEKLNDSFEDVFKKQNNSKLTMRFSPGYGDLHISVNKIYVELLGIADKVRVLDTGLMIPRKTTACIVGIGE